MKHLIIVRGGGELGSGIAHCLHRAGFRVLILEQKKPTATRRKVTFSDAMYRGESEVERVSCHRAKSLEEAQKRLKKGEIMMIADPEAKCVAELKPDVLTTPSSRTRITARRRAWRTSRLRSDQASVRDAMSMLSWRRGVATTSAA